MGQGRLVGFGRPKDPCELQTTVTRHWNERASSYVFNIRRDFFRPKIADAWRHVLAEFVGPPAGLRILDAGCGPGPVTKILVELGHEVTAVDVSREMLARAEDVVGADAHRVRFLLADATTIPIPDASFDAVISRYLLWTLPTPEQAVREWYRLLRPGGRLGIIDGNWYRRFFRSRVSRLWHSGLNLYYRMRSGCGSSQKLADEYARDLPATAVLRPDWDLGLLAGVGFVDLTAQRDLSATVYGLSWRRIEAAFSGLFLVRGTKPCS